MLTIVCRIQGYFLLSLARERKYSRNVDKAGIDLITGMDIINLTEFLTKISWKPLHSHTLLLVK